MKPIDQIDELTIQLPLCNCANESPTYPDFRSTPHKSDCVIQLKWAAMLQELHTLQHFIEKSTLGRLQSQLRDCQKAIEELERDNGFLKEQIRVAERLLRL